MATIAPGWRLEVERGPDWLIVTLDCDHEHEWDSPPLADGIWEILEQHFTYRVVLDLGRVQMLHTWLIGQLVRLHQRAAAHDGVVRVCGLSERNRDVLRSCRLDGYFPSYHDRAEALFGSTTTPKPR